MQVERAYEKFLLKANENFETSKIAVDRGRFTLLFNEAQNKMLENILDRKADDEYRYIQKLLVKNKEIPREASQENLDLFPLPKNYFDFSSAYTKATSKGNKCTDVKIYLYEVKDDNIVEVLQDEFQKPSFIAREAPFSFTSDKIAVYKEDFKNDSLVLSYYRYPLQIQLIDEEDPESAFNEDYPIEFDDKFTDRIISMAVSEFEINNSNDKFNINKQQSINKF